MDANERIFHVRAFQNAYYTTNITFFLDFPPFEKTDREMVVASPITHQTKSRLVDKDDDITFFGDVLFRIKQLPKEIAGQAAAISWMLWTSWTKKPLWSRNFPKQRAFYLRFALQRQSRADLDGKLEAASRDGESPMMPVFKPFGTRRNPKKATIS